MRSEREAHPEREPYILAFRNSSEQFLIFSAMSALPPISPILGNVNMSYLGGQAPDLEVVLSLPVPCAHSTPLIRFAALHCVLTSLTLGRPSAFPVCISAT